MTIRWTLISSFAALALSACAGATGADPSPDDTAQATAAQPLGEAKGEHRGRHEHDPAKFVEHFDANKDGKLQVAELPERMQKFLGDADTNKDGVLSTDELGAHHEAMKEQFSKMGFSGHRPPEPAEFVQRFDANKDGKLELAEVPAPLQKFFGRVDTDGDGAVTVDEITAARGAMKKEHFAKMDKSGDGSVTADEVDARRWERISKADADGNGAVTQVEMEHAIASGVLKPHWHHRHHGPGGPDRDEPPAPPATPAPAPTGS